MTAINRMGHSVPATHTYAAPSSDATLSNLELNGPSGSITLSPVFASATVTYSASVPNAV